MQLYKVNKLRLIIVLITFFQHSYLFPQTQELNLDRIYASGDFFSERFGPARWIDSGIRYTTLENSEEIANGIDIVSYNTKTGDRTILISSADLIPQGEKMPLAIQDYQWSSDKSKILIFTNTQRVWRLNTKGDYWVLDLKSKALTQIGKKFKKSSLMFAKFSPKGDKIAYVSEHNIYAENLNSGTVKTLTTDGNKKIINGTFDWAYEEEFGCRDGFRWSPDGNSIAYWQIDATDIKNFLLINNTDSLYSFTIPVEYPKVGEDPSSCKIGVVSVNGGQTSWLEILGDKKQNYLPRMKWSPDSKKVVVQQLSRKQNVNRLWSCNVVNETTRMIYKDENTSWVEVINNNDWIWLNDGKEFSWLSEKDGWRHFYSIEANGETEKLVTKGDFDVVNVLRIDEVKGFVYFIASPNNATDRYLYRTALSGNGEKERLTPMKEVGTHSYQIAPNGKYAIHTFSDINTLPSIDLVSLPDHKVIRQLTKNKDVIANLQVLNLPKAEFFKVTTENELELDGYIIKPKNFDPDKKYPILFFVYGEPAVQTTRNVWGHDNLWYHLIANKGYVVVALDNRGTPSPRGRDWRKSIYRKIGVVNVKDQVLAAKEVLKWDFVDEKRVAVWGWSGGGSMTLNLLFRYPEIYQTGMAVAPVANQLFYDNIYQERYMGVPWETNDDYIEGSPLTYAKNLTGNLLLVHGTGDDNVHYQNSEVLINELIKQDKYFQMMSYPNRSHGIYERENTYKHIHGLLTQYLIEHVKAGGQ